MLGFHVDMNCGQYAKGYLEQWFEDLAGMGYDTILWEVENGIQWETCPECVAPDAFTKQQAKKLLAYCRELELEVIPLFQTIGHAEYVLQHDPYSSWSEEHEHLDQYCPCHPEVVPFLHRWIHEYLEVFEDCRYFHIGADEAMRLGSCAKCKAYADEHSLSKLYIDHVNKVIEPLVAKNITPIIWADMILHHSEAIDNLSRKFMLFDWMYDVYRNNGKVWVWGKGRLHKKELDKQEQAHFWPYLFPHGDEPGREPETFYTADYLVASGFQVVTCPGSSSYGDTVFAPRNYYHMINTFDSTHKGMSKHLSGTALTSWSVHLFPWELQRQTIELAGWVRRHPNKGIDVFMREFVQRQFGLEYDHFGLGCGLLSRSCAFAHTHGIGHGKKVKDIPEDFVVSEVNRMVAQGTAEKELAEAKERLKDYREAVTIFDDLAGRATSGHDLIADWQLASRNLVNRAQGAVCVLSRGLHAPEGDPQKVLDEMRSLRVKTGRMYEGRIKPVRREQMVTWLFRAMEYALRQAK